MCSSHQDSEVTFTVQRISTLSEILTLDDPSVCGKMLFSMLMGRKLLVPAINTDMSATMGAVAVWDLLILYTHLYRHIEYPVHTLPL